MAKLLKVRLGVSDDPTALKPTLGDCLDAMINQSDLLITDVVHGLGLACVPNGPRRIRALQMPGIKSVVLRLSAELPAARASFKQHLSRLVYQGGGKETATTEVLRYEDLQLFGDAELDQSIEVARALQEVQQAVDDTLPALDALVSTLLGWRSIQPGLNPLRPDVFVRALQSCLAHHIPEVEVRESLVTPAAGLLGANLRKLYKELADWLASSGIEPAVPARGRVEKGTSGAGASPVASSVAKTLLTLDRLRKLLAGDFDVGRSKAEFVHTVPASMGMLEEMHQVDNLVKRLEQRAPKAAGPAPEVDMLASVEPALADAPRIGLQLGEEVVRLLFDNLTHDSRLVAEYKRQLKAIEPAVLVLAGQDSRFFSDREHPARQLLQHMTQRSLAFTNESDPGWRRFLATVEDAVRWLQGKPADAYTFGQLLDLLHAQWDASEHASRQRRDEAARALVHAEQRHLLAQRLAADFDAVIRGQDVPDFMADFLRNSWSQVVAESKLSGADGSDDPFGYVELVEELIWSVKKGAVSAARVKRLAQRLPTLLSRLREGLARIDYPEDLANRFFDSLGAVHAQALQQGREAARRAHQDDEPTMAWPAPRFEALVEPPAPTQPEMSALSEGSTGATDSADAAAVDFGDSALVDEGVWLAGREAADAGYLTPTPATEFEMADSDAVPTPLDLLVVGELRSGAWVELLVREQWLRVQLTWASPHHTLFMFTSPSGTAHSMSRRTLDKLRAQGRIKVVAERNLVDEALDAVAKAALRNSVNDQG